MALSLLLSLILACGDKSSDDTGSPDGGAGDGGTDDGGAEDGGTGDGGGAADPTVESGTIRIEGTTWAQISTSCDVTSLLSFDSALQSKGLPDLRLMAQIADSTSPPTGWYGSANGLIFNLRLTDGSAEWSGPPGVSDTVYLENLSDGRFELVWNDVDLNSAMGGPTYSSSGWLSCTL